MGEDKQTGENIKNLHLKYGYYSIAYGYSARKKQTQQHFGNRSLFPTPLTSSGNDSQPEFVEGN